jgi:alkylhydroperoxidase family enzyme
MGDIETTAPRIDWMAVQEIAREHVGDEAFARVRAHFSEREVAFLTTAIGQINFWNRIAAPFRFTPPIPAAS